MCEFCLKHGEGKKWYLEAKNYSEDLLSDLRRRQVIVDFLSNKNVVRTRGELRLLEMLSKAPSFVQRTVKTAYGQLYYKRNHWGQVLPIEDVEQIFEFVNSVARVACFCRTVAHNREQRFCYGLGLGPNGGRMGQILEGLDDSFLHGPDSKGLEYVDKEEALKQMRKMEKKGVCHTVWTFRTPFIGGICNCDRSDCQALTATVTHDLKLMFRAEYVARTNFDRCNGCRQCMRVCQFGAIQYSAAMEKVSIDPRRCYGCGICRSVCKPKAIRLDDRQNDPVAATIW